MILLLYYYIATFAALMHLMSSAHGLAIRDTNSDVSSTKGGILVKNGKQTSCELGVIDSTAAFVAAPCLDYVNNNIDKDTKYEVYLDGGIDGVPIKYTVSSITVHPDYNPTTILNPIAILQFNPGSTEIWFNSIAINQKSTWGDVLLLRRGLIDIDSMKWKTPLTTINQYVSVKDCSSDSRVYESNENDFICSTATTYSPYSYLTNCSIPYASVDVYISGKLYIAGIHAYTAVGFKEYQCTLRSFQDSLYVLFSDYIAFASKVLGREINYYPKSNNVILQTNADYSMTTPSVLLSPTIKTGDFYVNQSNNTDANNDVTTTQDTGLFQDSTKSNLPDYDSITLSSQTNETDSTSDSATDYVMNELLTTSYDNESYTNDNNDTSLKKQAIIGVTCGILGGILITCLLIYLFGKWKRAHRDIYKNRETRNSIRSMLVIDTNGIFIPPPIQLPITPIQKPSAHVLSLKSPLSAKSPQSAKSPAYSANSDRSSAYSLNILPPYQPNPPYSSFSPPMSPDQQR